VEPRHLSIESWRLDWATQTVDMIERASYGYMAGIKGTSIIEVKLEDVAKGSRTIPANDLLVNLQGRLLLVSEIET